MLPLKMLNFNIHNLISINIIGENEKIHNFLKDEFEYFIVSKLEKVNIQINFVKKIQLLKNSEKLLDDFYYNSLNKCFFLKKNNKWLSYSVENFTKNKIIINIEENFNKWFVLYAIENSLYVLMGKEKYCMLHAGGIVKNSKTLVVSGTQGSGKTSEVLNGVAKGSDFLGDEYIFVNENGECLSFPRCINFNKYHGKHYELAFKINWKNLSLLKKIKWLLKEFFKSILLRPNWKPTIRMKLSKIYNFIKVPKKVKAHVLLVKKNKFDTNKNEQWNDLNYCNFLLENIRFEIINRMKPYLDSLSTLQDDFINEIKFHVMNVEKNRKTILSLFLKSVSKKIN